MITCWWLYCCCRLNQLELSDFSQFYSELRLLLYHQNAKKSRDNKSKNVQYIQLYSIHGTPVPKCVLLCNVYTVQFIQLYSIHRYLDLKVLYSVHCTVYTIVQHTQVLGYALLCIVHCTVYTVVQPTPVLGYALLCRVHCTKYTIVQHIVLLFSSV